ncbi:MAG: hypothetical protein RIC55_37185 [Pirellulaceae bacterium]
MLSVVCSMAFAVAFARAAEEPEYTIKEVMKIAHKDGLLKKVASGDGTADDAKMLLKLYQAMAANKPKKGGEDSWKEKNAAIVAAAEGVVAGKDGAAAALGKATNCANCHKVHK